MQQNFQFLSSVFVCSKNIESDKFLFFYERFYDVNNA